MELGWDLLVPALQCLSLSLGRSRGGSGCFVVFWGVGWSRAGKEPSEGWEDDGLCAAAEAPAFLRPPEAQLECQGRQVIAAQAVYAAVPPGWRFSRCSERTCRHCGGPLSSSQSTPIQPSTSSVPSLNDCTSSNATDHQRATEPQKPPEKSAELKAAVLDKTAKKDNHAQLAALKQAWREADALNSRSLKRSAEGLSAEELDGPLDPELQKQVEAAFRTTYSWPGLPSKCVGCDSLLGRCKREFERRTPSMLAVTRVRTLAQSQRGQPVKVQRLSADVSLQLGEGEE